jgi:uncharacterized protein
MEQKQSKNFYVLSLDGGGSLGVYTIRVLKEFETYIKEKFNKPLHEKFDLIYGTSTGSIIAALLGLGKGVDEISELYFKHIPNIMRPSRASLRSKALRQCASEVFSDYRFNGENFKTFVGVVATYYRYPKPAIFKSSIDLFQGGTGGEPGFGCKIADAIIASCSAAPLFTPHEFDMPVQKRRVEMIDGGFVANNPTLFAITDAKNALGYDETRIKVLNIGVGSYPLRYTGLLERVLRTLPFTSRQLELFTTTLSASNNTIDQLQKILFPDVSVIRISEPTPDLKLATNLLESNSTKLNAIQDWGFESYRSKQKEIECLFN